MSVLLTHTFLISLGMYYNNKLTCPFIAVKENNIDSMLIALTAINGHVWLLFSLRELCKNATQ